GILTCDQTGWPNPNSATAKPPMRIAHAAALVVVGLLGWFVFSTNTTIRQQEAQIEQLKTSLTDRSQQQALASQRDCAESAHKFLVNGGWKLDEAGLEYRNHFNARLNKCFVLISSYSFNNDVRDIGLYDAVEGNRYAGYTGHDICDPTITRD